MKKSIKEYITYLVNSFIPSSILQARLHKRVFLHFADRVGLVYFGFVNQRSDDHKLVRGLTMSSEHRDEHYSVGTFKNYDIALVERFDVIRFPGKPPKAHDWIIMTFDLHTHYDIPHAFIGLYTHSETFYAHLFTKFSKLTKVDTATLPHRYANQFTERYALYTSPAHSLELNALISDEMACYILDHFGSLTIELHEGCLYVYAEHQRPTNALLEKMLGHGLWLAQAIDARANDIRTELK